MSEVVKTHPLKEPIDIRNKDGELVETITELKLRKPKGKILKALDRAEGEVGKTLALIAAMAGLPPSTMDELGPQDFVDLGEVIEKDFFGGRLPTGRTSSEI